MAIRVRDERLALTTMRFGDEIRPTKGIDTGGRKPAKQQLDHAVALIEALSADWDPGDWKDRYRERLEDVIARKRKGKRITAPKARQGALPRAGPDGRARAEPRRGEAVAETARQAGAEAEEDARFVSQLGSRHMDAAVIGRDEELAVTRAFLSGLPAGPRALRIEGEAGIGKTAVWLAALDDAAARGYRVLRCAGEESEARLSLVGLADLIGDAAGDGLAALPGPQREALDVALLRTRRRGRARGHDRRHRAALAARRARALGARRRRGRRRAVAGRRRPRGRSPSPRAGSTAGRSACSRRSARRSGPPTCSGWSGRSAAAASPASGWAR